jgi:NADPH:quinone reductase-like Zn-dependent oxidoreductase/SAM-dependent methyltransferase/acyl carrier protein
MGWSPRVGEQFESNSLGESLGVIVGQSKLWVRLIGFLAEDGLIEPEGDLWRVVRPLPIESAEVLWRKSLSDYPVYSAEILLLGRCASNLADFLIGKQDPLSFIFADGSTLAEHFYRHSPTYRIYNHLMRDLVRQMLALLPPGKKLRVLEVGGGTGSLAFQILPWLPPSRTTYTFTDISNSFVIQAQRRFRDYSFVEYRQLDLEKSLSEQGLEVGQFDLVLASDVLHATADLRRSLSTVKKLLAPGGMLLCLEMTRDSRWLDMIFGLLPGWWLFSDYDLRPDHALMTEKCWCELLGSEGFTQVATLSDRSNISNEPQHTILAALSPCDDANTAEHPIDLNESQHDTGEEISVEVQKNLLRPWIIYQDNCGIANKLAGKLGEYNINPLVVEAGGGFELKDIGGGNSPISPVLVYVCKVEDSEKRDPVTVLDDLTDECMAFLRPLQELMRHEWQELPLVYLVTSGSQNAAGVLPRAEQASIWNLRRVLANERPEWKTVAIDLSPEPVDHEIEGLIKELLTYSLEDEVALRGSSRFVHRLVRRSVNELVSSESTAFELQSRQRRSINGLAFARTVRQIPQPKEVEVNIKACGLNFKDVAKLTGLLDNTSAAETSLDKLGLEIAGVVTAVGAEVEDLRIGDRVFGFAANGFRSYLTVASQALVRMPERLSFEEAATIPVAYSTVWLALRELVGIKPGERVLVHSASGAVGMAAINVALDVGAVVYATAGSPEKRAIVAALGAIYVGDSRAKNFAAEILEHTAGEGVDVILNTLPSSTFSTSLAALKPYSGRMIDISNVYEKNIAMAPLCKGVAFYSFDMERMLPEHPKRVHSILTEVSAKIDRGELSALPSRVFEAAEIRDAFQLMRSSRHIGKIVVSFEEAPVRVEFTNEQMPVRSDGTYLITGGFGGVGLATAKWLSESGARYLVLVGRSGAATEEAKKTLQDLRDMGVQVVEEESDISSPNAAAEIMERITRTAIPLRGVIHGAMVLDDMSLEKITATSMRNVLNPKVLGLINLHQATKKMSLDFFVCHSSFASLFGNQDQGNYVAANGFMEALMQSRRDEGLPGLAMCWGVLGEFGYVANNADIKDFFKREGMMPLLPAQTWRSLIFGLEQKSAVLGVMNVNFRKLARYMESISTLPRYSFLAHSAGHGEGGLESQNSESGQSFESLEQAVTRAVTNTLGIARDQLDLDASLESLGFDSLMAMEMVVAVEEAVGIKLAKMILMQGGLNTRGLIQIVEDERLKKGLPPAKELEIQKVVIDPETYVAGTVYENDDISSEVSRLTDEQVDQLLISLTNEKLGEA